MPPASKCRPATPLPPVRAGEVGTGPEQNPRRGRSAGIRHSPWGLVIRSSAALDPAIRRRSPNWGRARLRSSRPYDRRQHGVLDRREIQTNALPDDPDLTERISDSPCWPGKPATCARTAAGSAVTSRPTRTPQGFSLSSSPPGGTTEPLALRTRRHTAAGSRFARWSRTHPPPLPSAVGGQMRPRGASCAVC